MALRVDHVNGPPPSSFLMSAGSPQVLKLVGPTRRLVNNTGSAKHPDAPNGGTRPTPTSELDGAPGSAKLRVRSS